MRALSALLILLILPAAAQPLPEPGEGVYAWETLGDAVMDAVDMAFADDGTLYVSDDDLTRYDVVTETWTEIDLPNPPRNADTILPLRGDTLLASAARARSFDGGLSWELVCWPYEVCPYALDHRPHALAEITAGPYAGRLLAAGRAYSDDRGATWTDGAVPAEVDDVFAMTAFAPLPSGAVIGGGRWGAAWSPDGGETWTPSPLYGPYGFQGAAVTAFATPGSVQAYEAGGPAPACGLSDAELCEGAVWLGSSTEAVGVRSYWTNDGGRTWTEGTPLPQVADGPAWSTVGYLGELERAGPQGLGMGLAVLGRGFVYATVDGGVTWEVVARVPLSPSGGHSVRTAALGPDGRLYIVWRSDSPVYVTAGPASEAFAGLVSEASGAPDRLELGVRVVPNPSAGGAVAVELTGDGAARATVVDTRGRVVAELYSGELRGERTVGLDTSGWAAGVYTVVVEAGGERTAEAFTIAR